MINAFPYKSLDDKTKELLNSIISSEFKEVPIVQELEWAEPDWSVIRYRNRKIVSFCNIVERIVDFDENEYKIGGINNVITPERFRGKGYATEILMYAQNFIFNDLGKEYGMLLCGDDLLEFYKKLSWYKVDGPVTYLQSTGIRTWKANVMLLAKEGKILAKKIDLNGLPW